MTRPTAITRLMAVIALISSPNNQSSPSRSKSARLVTPMHVRLD